MGGIIPNNVKTV